ncbi:AfsR/SARP family transcriptional regulator [Nocardia terpenica]|uniref:AfsR/SARP family transcriptional regulator n=1 Tax=Nocardia terpenica TaxID=455432 RepID=UPI0002F39459|nr:BTAD domain-containing putative transcriptional regulator [Nocardia terpenica]NQE87049.1 hypothetical protein [Nocardia terpenica]
MNESVSQNTGDQKVRFFVLGPLLAYRGTKLVDLGPAKQRSLLGVLALHPNQPVTRTEIIDSLWADHAPTSVQNLVHTYIARLRLKLEQRPRPRGSGEVIVSTAQGYMLNADTDQLDLLRFRELLKSTDARRDEENPDIAFATLREAVDLWRGDILTDVRLDSPSMSATVALRHEYVMAAIRLAQAANALERDAEVLPTLERAVHIEPLHEGICARLMIALASSGNQVGALRVFHGLRVQLQREFGVDPGPELRRAHQRVLRHEIHSRTA